MDNRKFEAEEMSDMKRNEILARLDELDQMSEKATDEMLLEYIAERKKVLRSLLTIS